MNGSDHTIERLPGFAPLAGRYDGFILDLWGVIHDGVTPYPGAVDCLTRLRDAGKRVVLLSNAPRRSQAAQAMLRRMGIPDDFYTGVLTSGEAVHLALRDRAAPGADPWYAALGPRLFHLGPERDRNVFAGLPFTQAATPAEADLVLNTGPDDHREPTGMAAWEPVLRDCAAHRLPMICANPDLEVIRGGQRVLCAGALAQRYGELGGDVRSMGKPDPAIYAPVLATLAVPPARVLAVGDALRTDIAGAAAVGLDSCWVLGGIHGHDPHPHVTARAAGLAPVAMLDGFRWGG